MEAGEIKTQPCKFSRGDNGRSDSTKMGQRGGEQYPDDEEDEKLKRINSAVGAEGGDFSTNHLLGWHHSSRIIRVSRASGGKDRHSKVWTSKGPRDRRVRLSVTTAIQFYDLQDRLGYDQPSKAVEWLIQAAANSINELPSLNSTLSETPLKQLSTDKRISEGTGPGFDSPQLELEEPDFNQNPNQHHPSLFKSASSNSETSKGSGLSLSRSEIRVNQVKTCERARERAKKEKNTDSRRQHMNPITQNSTFTELLSGGMTNVTNNTPSLSSNSNARQWPSTPMDYFNTGLQAPSSSRASHHLPGFQEQIRLGNSIPQALPIPPFSLSGQNLPELQHFQFATTDHLMLGPGGDYNINFSISSSLPGINGGTLQSNSPSLLPHLYRFSSPIEGANLPFFIGTPPVENHHHHFPSGLQLCYNDGSRHTDHKGKGKN